MDAERSTSAVARKDTGSILRLRLRIRRVAMAGPYVRFEEADVYRRWCSDAHVQASVARRDCPGGRRASVRYVRRLLFGSGI